MRSKLPIIFPRSIMSPSLSAAFLVLGLRLCYDFRDMGELPFASERFCALSFWNPSRRVCDKEVKFIRHCLSYRSKDKCQMCALGFAASDTSSSCNAIADRSCITTRLDGSCNACLDGKVPDESGSCEKGKACKENCEVCMNSDSCILCKAGYSDAVVEGQPQCVKDSAAMAHCWIGGERGCLLCKFGYFILNGACFRTDAYRVEMYPDRDSLAF